MNYLLKEPVKWKYLSPRWSPLFAKCFRCGFEWVPRVEEVKTCAKCRSPYWDRARNDGEYKTMQDFAIGVMQGKKYAGLYGKPSDHKCVDCGKPATHWEHRNYARPLMVEPVCTKCNHKRGGTPNKPLLKVKKQPTHK